MMNDTVREQLIRIVRENGEEVLLNPSRTKGFLNDFCGNKYKREINSITLALKEGAVKELLKSRRNRTERFAIARLSENLEESFGFPKQQTIWTVESIALALGIKIQDEPIDTVEKAEGKAPETKPLDLSKVQVTRKEEIEDEKKEAVSTSVYSTSTSKGKTGKKRRIGLRLFGISALIALILVFILISRNKSPIIPSMILVEKGSFTMGDTWSDGESDEKPTHKVTFTYDFYIGKYETTFDEYDAFCNATGRSKLGDSGFGRGSRPVFNVTWWDAIDYCNWLSEKEKLPKAYDNNGNLLDKDGRITTDITKVLGYRLPTEAEWEYAARGGNKSKGYRYAGSDNVNDVAWYYSNSGGKTQEVGQKKRNELGLYDMSGNVWEWCSDWWDISYYSKSPTTNPYNSTAGSRRVLRGGSWLSDAAYGRVAYRGSVSPSSASSYLGFRICRTVP